jgi:hypothetical protein
MTEFFKGWLRQCGLVTLLFALAFMSLWVRSTVRVDEFAVLKQDHLLVRLVSQKDGLRLELYRSTGRLIVDGSLISVASEVSGYWGTPFHYTLEHPKSFSPVTLLNRPAVNSHPIEWWFRSQGVGIGQCMPANLDGTTRLDLWLIPHRFIVIPLTVLSAFFLLFRPSKSVRMKIGGV